MREKRFALSLGLPEDSTGDCARVTLVGQSAALVEGQHGVIELTESRVRLRTGRGVLSVLVFAKDLLVGIVVSVYILARKETFGLHTRKLLYSLVSAPHYERALRATREADRIFSGFVRGKLLDSLIIGILCFIVC